MARRKQGGFELLAAAPWPVGIIAGIAAFLFIRYGIAWYFLNHGGTLLRGLGEAAHAGSYNVFAWTALAACWLAALASWIGRRRRAALLDANTSLQRIRDLSWPRFELLVGESFRRQGYSVEETGLGGADGGIDLHLRRDGRREIVQCKQWRTARVSVAVVREMYGLLVHHRADAVKIVTVGGFTPDALEFARGKPVELIDGPALLRIVECVSAGMKATAVLQDPQASHTQHCARCGNKMIERKNRRNGETFIGCSGYPACRNSESLTLNEAQNAR